MANPQPDYHIRISQEYFRALNKFNMCGSARQMLGVIISKTWGFNKKSDKISTSQFMKETNLSRETIHKTRQILKEMNMITIVQSHHSQVLTYSVQKDYEKWKPYYNCTTVVRKRDRYSTKQLQVYPISTTAFTTDTLSTDTLPTNKRKKKEKLYAESSDEFQLSSIVYDFLKKRGITTKTDSVQKWCKHIDLLIRADGRSVREIKEVIAWYQQDVFWSKTIASTSGLRKNYKKLKLQMQEKGVTEDGEKRTEKFYAEI